MGQKLTVDQVINTILNETNRVSFLSQIVETDLRLSRTEIVALLMIEGNDGGSMSRLAECVNIPMSTATGIVDRLLRRGYVVRRHGEDDRRLVNVFLTEKGKETAREIQDHVEMVVQKILDGLTASESRQLFQLIQKVLQILSEPSAEVGLNTRNQKDTSGIRS